VPNPNAVGPCGQFWHETSTVSRSIDAEALGVPERREAAGTEAVFAMNGKSLSNGVET
jgi:hypothetical protein